MCAHTQLPRQTHLRCFERRERGQRAQAGRAWRKTTGRRPAARRMKIVGRRSRCKRRPGRASGNGSTRLLQSFLGTGPACSKQISGTTLNRENAVPEVEPASMIWSLSETLAAMCAGALFFPVAAPLSWLRAASRVPLPPPMSLIGTQTCKSLF